MALPCVYLIYKCPCSSTWLCSSLVTGARGACPFKNPLERILPPADSITQYSPLGSPVRTGPHIIPSQLNRYRRYRLFEPGPIPGRRSGRNIIIIHVTLYLIQKAVPRSNMAELNLGKGLTAGKVASNVQKKLTRAQEKVRSRLVHVYPSRSPLRQCRIPGRVSHHDTRPLSQTLVNERLASTPNLF